MLLNVTFICALQQGNVLFNNTLNTFYFTVIWRRTNEIVREETRCHHMGYSFRLTEEVFYMHYPTARIAHTMAFVKPVVEHWLEWEIAQWDDPVKDRSDDPSHHERMLLPWSYISLRSATNCPFPQYHGSSCSLLLLQNENKIYYKQIQSV